MFLRKKSKRIKRFNQHQKNFKNPYFKNKKKKDFDWVFLVNALFYSSLIFSSMLLVYLFLYSPLFKIKEVEILGNKYISNYDIKSYYYNFLDKNKSIFLTENNILILNTEDLAEDIKLNNNFIQSAEVKKNARNLISIQIKEKEIAGYWKSGEDIYSFDLDGKIINILNENGGLVNKQQVLRDGKYYGSINMAILAKHPLIIDYRYNSFESGQSIALDPKKTAMIMDIFDYINKNELFLVTSFSFLDDIYQNLIVKTLDDYVVYFSLLEEEDLAKSLDRLEIFFNQTLDPAIKANLEYIDLRMSEKIFYK